MDNSFVAELFKTLGEYIIIKTGDTIIYSNLPSDFPATQEEAKYNDNYFDAVNRDMLFNGVNYQITCFHDVTALKKKINEDSKTGILSNDGFNEAVVKIIQSKEPFVLGMFDIDNFKKFNDTYGHKIGDEVLTAVSQIFDHNIKKDDLVGRFGGDEFVFVLKGMSIDMAKARIGFISSRISGGLKFSNNMVLPVSISVGMNDYDYSKNFSDNLKIVDDYLYESKNNGKNQISFSKGRSR